MVAARSAAMGFNRLVDARIDALNPRTAMRELPRGAMTRARGDGVRRRRVGRVRLRRVAAESALLRAVAGRAGDRVLVLAGQALHDLDAAVPRPGDGGGAGRRLAGGRRPRRVGAVAARRWRSAPGSAASTSSMPARISSSIARTACGRFRCASACRRRWRSRARMHVVAVVVPGRRSAWSTPLGRRSISPASRVVAALLVYEQSLVSADDLSQVKRAFDLNGYVGILYLLVHRGVASMSADAARAVDRGRDHRRERRDLRDADARGAARARLSTSSWSSPTTAGGCCATSSATQASVDRLRAVSRRRSTATASRAARCTLHSNRTSARRSPAAATAAAAWRSCRAR